MTTTEAKTPKLTISEAKTRLDTVINKSRVHFYKPFQIAEILRHNRLGSLNDLQDLETYRSASKKWRDLVSAKLVGRVSTSSAKYQDDVFNATGCPPAALVVLGDVNRASNGAVEAYIYRMFEAKVSTIGAILATTRIATPQTFDLRGLILTFERKPGLKRSIDKVFEITVYALFSTIVRALNLRVKVSIDQKDPILLKQFEGFLAKVVGIEAGCTSVEMPASLFRLGSTNAADRGLDMIANFGPAVQVKHLTLDADAIADICDGITASKIVIVCKDHEVDTVESLMSQVGMRERLQGIVTFSDLLNWYNICFQQYPESLGQSLLKDFIREFSEEFPSIEGLGEFLSTNGYDNIKLTAPWLVV